MILLKSIIFGIFIPGTVTVFVPYLILSSQAGGLARGSQMTLLSGVAAIVAGVYVCAHCTLAFVLRGRGTPAPFDPPRTLVVSGFYRYVRNPIYVGLLVVLIGEAVLFSSPSLVVYTAVVAVLFHLFVVWYEEPHLTKVFGQEYVLYMERVPRWVPRPPEKRTQGETTAEQPAEKDEERESS